MLHRPCEYLAANAAGEWDTGAALAIGNSHLDAKVQNLERFCKFLLLFFGLILAYSKTVSSFLMISANAYEMVSS